MSRLPVTLADITTLTVVLESKYCQNALNIHLYQLIILLPILLLFSVSAAYEKMRAMQHTLKVASSWPIKECMSLVDDTLIKHNFYTDKYDQTGKR